jgi:predicted dienelactone hydrolase
MRHLAFAAFLAAINALPAASAEPVPGYDRFDLVAAHRARPVAASIWYPAAGPTYRVPVGDGPIFEPTIAHIGPAVAEGRHPLVLLSHGSGGNADAIGWLSAGLVARGAIVLAVDHPGSTSGDSSPRRSVDLVARAGDLSAALESVLADPAFARSVDPDRISAVGFSLGGTTVLGLAGLRFDGAAQDVRCTGGPDAADCGFFLRGGVRFAHHPGFAGDMRDPRITRAVAVDPGFGGAVVEASLDTVMAEILLINLGQAHRMGATDVGPQGNDLARRLAGANYAVLAPANHFTFLGTCKAGAVEMLAEEGEDPICTDPEGADRVETHNRLIEAIAANLRLPGAD